MKTTIALQPPMALALVYWVTVAFWGGGADGATSDDVVHDTSLGLVTRACAARYCRRGTNAVDLWVYVDQVNVREPARCTSCARLFIRPWCCGF